MAKKYEELASKVLELVGGKQNISYVTHCVTRLRFNLKDKSIAKVSEIGDLNGVMGTQWQGEQLQIIIGHAVTDVYQAICDQADLSKEKAVDENLDEEKKKFSINTIFDAISGCITPLVPALIGTGLIKIVLILGELTGLLTAESSTYTFLSVLGDAAFYFLPIFVGASSAKKFGANMYLGMVVGAMFVHPNLVAALSEGKSLTVFGLPVHNASYLYSIFPVILSVCVMAPIQKFFGKHLPSIIRTMAEPLLTLLIILPLALCVLGPAGAVLGTYITSSIMWIYDTIGFLGIAVLAAVLPWLVMTGMHTALTPYSLSAFANLGYEPITMTATIVSNINQGAACLIVALKTKNKDLKATALSSGITAIVGGITEPALFGVNLRLKTPMYGAMIGSFVGALIAGLGKSVALAFPGSGGIFALPIYISSDASNLLWICVGIAVGFVVTLIATYFLYKDVEVNE